MSYETAFIYIANELNCIPICLGSKTDGLDNLDLITPSRLLLGRNNTRALSGYARFDKPSRLIRQLDNVYSAWWDVWLSEKLADYIPRSKKWQKDVGEVGKDDIIIFLKLDKDQTFGTPVWRVGMVAEAIKSADGKIRKVKIKYKNATEKVFRFTERSVRSIAVLHREGEINLMDGLANANKPAVQVQK